MVEVFHLEANDEYSTAWRLPFAFCTKSQRFPLGQVTVVIDELFRRDEWLLGELSGDESCPGVDWFDDDVDWSDA